MPIQLSERFTFIKLLRFTIPTIIMLIFTSVYNVVDGFFVSNYVGKTSFRFCILPVRTRVFYGSVKRLLKVTR